MYLDALTLAALADELRPLLVGGRVQAIVPADPLTLVIEVYAGRRYHLLLSAHPQSARVHLADKGRRGVEGETPFLLLLRKYVKEARLTGVHVPPWERILHLDFEGHEGRSRLVAELMGRLSNLILVDTEGVIRDSARRITPDMTRARVVLPRQPYVPPPPIDRPAADEISLPALESLFSGSPADRPVWRALTGGLRGLSPLAAREVVYRALDDAEASVGDIDRVSPLLDALVEMGGPLTARGATWQPSQVLEEGAVIAFAPYLLTHLPDPQPVASLSAAIAAYFEAQVGRDAYAAARGRVQALISAARDKTARQRVALARETLSPADLEQRRLWGEWLLAYAHAVPAHASEYTIEDTGDGPLTIPLDPSQTAVENAQRLFRDYERARRAGEDLAARLATVDLLLAGLDQLATDLALAESRPEIDAVHAQFAALVGEKSPQVQRGGRPASPIEVTSPDGFIILVGRNSRQNDSLTFERATAHDLWLHARGLPGAHVIVKTEGRAPPEATLAAAASLAAYYSAARSSTNVAVDVTEVRRVKRLKGGGPGLVTYSGEKTIHATPHSAEEIGD